MAAIFLAVVLTLLLAFVSKLFIKENSYPCLPNGSMGYFPLLGETLSFLKPHKSNSIGTFLQQHCSRYVYIYMYN